MGTIVGDGAAWTKLAARTAEKRVRDAAKTFIAAIVSLEIVTIDEFHRDWHRNLYMFYEP